MAGTEFDTRDFRARIAFQSSIVHWRAVHFSGSAAFLTRGTDNSVYRGLNLGADVTGSLGVYGEGGFAAVQSGKDKAIITHITHTDGLSVSTNSIRPSTAVSDSASDSDAAEGGRECARLQSNCVVSDPATTVLASPRASGGGDAPEWTASCSAAAAPRIR